MKNKKLVCTDSTIGKEVFTFFINKNGKLDVTIHSKNIKKDKKKNPIGYFDLWEDDMLLAVFSPEDCTVKHHEIITHSDEPIGINCICVAEHELLSFT